MSEKIAAPEVWRNLWRFISINIPLCAENVIFPKVNSPALEINGSSALEHKTNFILPEPREYVFGSVAVPCSIAIGSHNLHVWHNVIILLICSSLFRLHPYRGWFLPKISLGIDEELQVIDCVVRHWIISPVFTLGDLSLFTNSGVRCNDCYLSVLSSSYCRPWPSPHSSGICAICSYFEL